MRLTRTRQRALGLALSPPEWPRWIRARRDERRLRPLIERSALFDRDWYLANNPDVAESGLDPVLHYLRHGSAEGRDPSPAFRRDAYLARYPDVAGSGLDPFVHYVLYGRGEGREIDLGPARTSRPARDQSDVELGHSERADPSSSMQELEGRLESLRRALQAQVARTDWALASIEGIAALIDEYHEHVSTPDYMEAYEVEEPLVSVCIPTVDRAELLVGRAIQSVLRQSYRNLQIVVVGDRCTDDTEQRLAALEDPRITFVNLPERGPYPKPGIDRWMVAGTNAINHALTLAEGHFVTHLDDDDAMVPHRIERLVEAARSQRADFLFHPFWYERRDGRWTRTGNGALESTQVTTGSVFYHRFFTRVPWDVSAFRLGEAGDWNRFRKIKVLRPRLHYVDDPLLYHHVERAQPDFVPKDGERFLE